MLKKERSVFVDKNINEQELDRYSYKLLLKILIKKGVRKIGSVFGQRYDVARTVCYNGVTVFGTRHLDGEGTTVGQDFIRVLLELGLKRCGRIFEFCAGPGYIGYSLLSRGFCEKLTLADINPEAVNMARKTVQFNGISHLVNIYQSDCLEQVPSKEKWDLVVSNPPHFNVQEEALVPKDPRRLPELSRNEAAAQASAIKAYDPDWSIHKRFYASIKKFMKSGGLVVIQENSRGSNEDIFVPMIEQGGGKFIKTCSGTDICGNNNGMYYVVSQW